jgi:DNA primase
VISPETIALVRDRTDIVAVITEAVPSLKKRGRTFVGLCPFHKEKTPSFHVNPDRGFFHCFGCQESGSAIDFLMKHDGYTFPEAIRALGERAGIAVEETKSSAAFTESDRQKKAKEDLYAVNALAAAYFEEQLRKHEHRDYALEELAKRGLTPGTNAKIDDALQAFRIGYAPSGWDGLATFLRAQGVSPVAAETVGLLVPRSTGSGYYDRFRHRLMFAVVDAQGRVVAFSGRALRDLPGGDEDRDKGGPPPKYINSPECPIYTKGQMLFGIHQARHAIRKDEEAILVEGNFDVVSLHARGLVNVVAPLGTAFTPEQAKLLKRFASSVVFLFDGDAAGRKAVRLSREAIRAAGLSARVAELPDGVDPDEVSKEKGIDAVKHLVASAKGMLEALIEMALDDSFNQADAHEKQSRLAYVAKLIAEENDAVVQAMLKGFTDMIAGRLDIVRAGPGAFAAVERAVREQVHAERRRIEEQVREAARKAAAAGAPPPAAARARARAAEQPQSNGRHIPARQPGAAERKEIVLLLVEWPALLEDRDVAEELALLEGPSVTVVAALRRCLRDRAGVPQGVAEGAAREGKTLDTEAFLSQIPDAVRPWAAQRLADPTCDDVKAAKEYLLDNAKKLKRLLLSQEAAQIARETYRAQGDWDTERELLREAAERLRTKHGLKT